MNESVLLVCDRGRSLTAANNMQAVANCILETADNDGGRLAGFAAV